jgi:hypothetical protein
MSREKVKEIVDYMVSEGTQNTNYGCWAFDIPELCDKFGLPLEWFYEHNDDICRELDERPVEFLHAIIMQLSFFVTNQCHLIVPRVNSLNRAFHLFLERFQRTVNVDHFRVMLWANPQNFHTVNLPNCTSKI